MRSMLVEAGRRPLLQQIALRLQHRKSALRRVHSLVDRIAGNVKSIIDQFIQAISNADPCQCEFRIQFLGLAEQHKGPCQHYSDRKSKQSKDHDHAIGRAGGTNYRRDQICDLDNNKRKCSIRSSNPIDLSGQRSDIPMLWFQRQCNRICSAVIRD